MARDIFSNPWVFDAATQGEGGSLGTTWIHHGTFTSATTDISTMAAHGFTTGNGPVRVTTSDTLPTGLAVDTDYYIERLSATTFAFATSIANAQAGTAIDITGTGSGTHTLRMQKIFPGRIYVETIIFEAAGAGGTYEIHDAVGGRSLTGLLTLAANAHTQIVVDAAARGVYLTTLTDGRALIYHGEV
jgi:hypothetical protein